MKFPVVVETGALPVHDPDFRFQGLGIVGADFGAVPVLERGDDPTAVGVIFRVCAGHDVDIQRQADLVAADLHIPLFHDVEEADLDFFAQIRQFVDGEDAPVRAGNKTVMDRQLVRKVPPLGDFDRIDLADQIGDRDVRRGELFAVSFFAPEPGDFRPILQGPKLFLTAFANRVVGAVVDLAPGQGRDLFIQQVDHAADHPGFRLAPLTQKNYILPGQDGVFELRDDGFLVSDDTREKILVLADLGDQVPAHLSLDGLRDIIGLFQLCQRVGPWPFRMFGHGKFLSLLFFSYNVENAGRQGSGPNGKRKTHRAWGIEHRA